MCSMIIELLDLPRRLIRDQVAIETCQHAGFFSPRDPGCRVCETRLECEWLFHNDEFAALSEKPVDALLDALESSVHYVDACITFAHHDRRTCACELCSWLEQAKKAQALSRTSVESPSRSVSELK